jgi:tetratricopeptide (TPR) repeat protein
MDRTIAGAAVLMIATAVQPAIADDRDTCETGTADEAIAACSRLLALDPHDTFARNNHGNAYFRNGDYDRAIADYDQALTLDPKLSAAYNGRGNAYTGKGDYDRAIADYDQTIRLAPKFPGAWGKCVRECCTAVGGGTPPLQGRRAHRPAGAPPLSCFASSACTRSRPWRAPASDGPSLSA